MRLALAYRQEFGHDIVVDLVGYRRFGHNEQDEAAYTQPLMVAQIAQQPVGQLYAARLVAEGVLEDEAKALFERNPAGASRRARSVAGVDRRAAPDEGGRIPADTGAGRHRRPGRPAPGAERAAARAAGRASREREAAEAARRRRERMDEGGIDWGRPRRSASPACSSRNPDSRLRPGHRTRHVLPPPRRPARPAHRRDAPIQVLPDATPRSRSTTLRSRSTPASASSMAMPSPLRTPSSSGRRSTATSSTARRS